MSTYISGNGVAALARVPGPVRHGAQLTTTPAASKNMEHSEYRERLSLVDVRQAVDHLHELLEPMARELQFSIDDETNRIVIKVIDIRDNTVLMQFPSEEIIALTHAIEQQAQGFLLSQKA